MVDNVKISCRQTSFLLISAVFPTAFLSLPTIACAKAGSDSWISVLIASFLGIVVLSVVVFLGYIYPGKTIIEYSEIIVGKAVGKAIGLIIIWFLLYLDAIIVKEFGVFIITVSMPRTPLIVFIVTILFVTCIAIRKGLEVIARTNETLLTITIISLFLIIILIAKDLDFSRITPVLADGFLPPLKGSIPLAGLMGEIFIMSFLLPHMTNPKKGYKAGITAILILCILLVISNIAVIMAFGHIQASRMQFPIFMIARYISLAEVIERTESLVSLIWMGEFFIKISLYYYITALAIAQWLKLNDYRPITCSVGYIIGSLTFLSFSNILELTEFFANTWGPYSLTIELVLPLILLAITFIRKKGGKVY